MPKQKRMRILSDSSDPGSEGEIMTEERAKTLLEKYLALSKNIQKKHFLRAQEEIFKIKNKEERCRILKADAKKFATWIEDFERHETEVANKAKV